MLFNDLPVSGAYQVIDLSGKILFIHEETESGDFPPMLAMQEIVNIEARNNYTIITIK